jgi:hypothetical protein
MSSGNGARLAELTRLSRPMIGFVEANRRISQNKLSPAL